MGNLEQEAQRLFFALIELDMDYAREKLPDLSCDLARLVAMHKARYEHTVIPAQYRHASRVWLQQHGYNRFKQLPWPPAGELPE